MNTTLWIIQGLLAFAFLMAGFMKASMPKTKLEEKMPWAKDFSAGTIKFIGIVEIIGAIGLILPMALNIFPILTIIAAFALAIVMLLAVRTHARRKEMKEMVINIILMALLLTIAFLR